jgi:hypothetical protein
MQTIERRVQIANEKEAPPAESFGGGLINYLNAKRGETHTTLFDGSFREEQVDARALVVLIKRFQTLEVLLSRNIVERASSSESWSESRPLTDREAEIVKLHDSINRFLKRYSARPFLSGNTGNPIVDWTLEWITKGSKIKTLELQEVREIVDVARAGRISAFKQCEQCQKWLFAKFSHQRFCSEDCKDQFHKTNEADKKRRRDWARKNYWIHKHKNVK